MKLHILLVLGAATGLGLTGCGGDIPPPKQLVDAQNEYARAKGGVAMQLDPTDVHEADLALQKAQSAWKDSQDPNDEWAAAQADVGRAEAGGAPDVPDAKLHLQLAQENLQKSKGLIDDDNERAASIIAVARAEAQLALSLAKAAQAEEASHKAQAELAKVKGQ